MKMFAVLFLIFSPLAPLFWHFCILHLSNRNGNNKLRRQRFSRTNAKFLATGQNPRQQCGASVSISQIENDKLGAKKKRPKLGQGAAYYDAVKMMQWGCG